MTLLRLDNWWLRVHKMAGWATPLKEKIAREGSILVVKSRERPSEREQPRKATGQKNEGRGRGPEEIRKPAGVLRGWGFQTRQRGGPQESQEKLPKTSARVPNRQDVKDNRTMRDGRACKGIRAVGNPL